MEKKLIAILVGVLIVVTILYFGLWRYIARIPPEKKISPELKDAKGIVSVVVQLAVPLNPILRAKFENMGMEIKGMTLENYYIYAKFDASKLMDLASIPEVVYIYKEPQAVFVEEGLISDPNLDEVKRHIRATGLDVDGSGITVGIVDSGIDCSEIKNKGTCTQYLCTHSGCVLGQGNKGPHGTSVTQILVSIAPGVNIISYDISDIPGSDEIESVQAMVNAWSQAISDKVNIIHMSAIVATKYKDSDINKVAERARDAGIVVSVAAGNEGPSGYLCTKLGYCGVHSPARVPNILSTGAVDIYDNIAGFSSRGWQDETKCNSQSQTSENCIEWDGMTYKKPEVVAVGVDITGIYSPGSGTSYAAPQTSALAALILQANPRLSNMQVREIIMATTKDLGVNCWDNDYGMGIIQADLAVQRARAVTSLIGSILSIFRR